MNSYKELIVWQKAIDLAKKIYDLTSNFPKSELYGLSIQMQKSAASIPSNIAEGQRRKTLPDFLHFLKMADGSAAELETQIIISKYFYYGLNYSEIESLLEEIQKMLSVLIKKLDAKNNQKLQTPNSKLQTNNGYIAITSSIIISFLLMTIVFTLSSASFFSRSNTLDANQKETSLGIAEACADTALLKLAQNSSYGGNENINIGSDSCFIFALESPSGQKIIKTSADYKGYRTNIKITMNHPAMTIISWEELPIF